MTVYKRLLWADAVRITAIYLVLLVHSSLIASSFSFSSLDTLILFAFAKTCVPLFVLLSGSLLLSKRESYEAFFRKRVLRLLIPWSIWAGIYTLIPINHPFPTTITTFVSYFQANFLYFWFFPMIMGLYLLTPAMRVFVRYAQKRDILLVIILWFLVISFLPYTRNSLAFPMYVDNSLLRQVVSYSGYYLLGHFLLFFRNKPSFLGWMLASLLGGILWTVGMEYTYALDHAGKISGTFFEYISPNMVLISCSLFGLLLCSERYVKTKITKKGHVILSTISSLSLGIYLIHGLVQRLFLIVFGKTIFPMYSPSLAALTSAFLLFCVSLSLIYLLRKIPFIGRFVS